MTTMDMNMNIQLNILSNCVASVNDPELIVTL